MFQEPPPTATRRRRGKPMTAFCETCGEELHTMEQVHAHRKVCPKLKKNRAPEAVG